MSTWILASDVVCVAAAAALVLVTLRTMIDLKRKHVERTMWTPVLFSAFVLFIGSVVSLLSMFAEILEVLHHVVWAIALMVLLYGIYSYSRMIRSLSLTEAT